MQSEIVRQLLRRLAAVRGIGHGIRQHGYHGHPTCLSLAAGA
jgi:hypothetical protein